MPTPGLSTSFQEEDDGFHDEYCSAIDSAELSISDEDESISGFELEEPYTT